MFSNCGKSFCVFLEKCFNIKTSNTTDVNIESQDLNQYLFADESHTFKKKNKFSILFSKGKKILKFNKSDDDKTENLNEYEPPINIHVCDSFVSVNSSDDMSNSDIDSDEEPKQLNIKKEIVKDETYFL